MTQLALALLEADREEPVEVVLRVHLERDEGLGALDTLYTGDALGDDLRELVQGGVPKDSLHLLQ